jgi:hypothetical protein
MLRFSTWKTVAILLMTLAAVLIVAPSMLTPSHYEELKAFLPGSRRRQSCSASISRAARM